MTDPHAAMRSSRTAHRGLASALVGLLVWTLTTAPQTRAAQAAARLPKIRVAPDGRGFVDDQGQAFVPFGVTYFRPGTGWAPQVWKQFDVEATRKDFAKLRALGGNCVRVFLSFGSFYKEPGELSEDGLAKFDRFLALAEEAGIYVHPTGPDHWEGLPEWARGDRLADENVLRALEDFWKLFATRYRGRNVIFAYDLLNEPEVRWDTPAMRLKWNAWLARQYGSAAEQATAWGATNVLWGNQPVPARDARPSRELLDFQHCREAVAVEWTRRQVTALKRTDPDALVTVGLIQWSVPVGIAGAWHYAAFRPEQQAPLLDFMEVHFYPLARGFYEYASDEDEQRNLAYLDCVTREVVRCGKPTVIAECGWYGGGQLHIDGGRHPAATEAQQARWCRRLVETTTGLACGWLNWSLHDHPGAGDVTELIGLLTADDREKAWGREFRELSRRPPVTTAAPIEPPDRPRLDWDRLVTDAAARDAYRAQYLAWFRQRGER